MDKARKAEVLEAVGFKRLPEEEGVYGFFFHAEAGIAISDDELAQIETETELHKRLKLTLGQVLKEFQGGLMLQVMKLDKMLKDRIQIVTK